MTNSTGSDGGQTTRPGADQARSLRLPTPHSWPWGSWAVRWSRSAISDAMVLIGIADHTEDEIRAAAEELDQLRHEWHQEGCQCKRCPGLRMVAGSSRTARTSGELAQPAHDANPLGIDSSKTASMPHP